MSKPSDKKPARMRASDVPVEYIKECLRMDEDGNLYWKPRPREHFTHPALYAQHEARVGARAGRANAGKWYLTVCLTYQGRAATFFNHRLVWLFVHGAWPVNVIDHINGEKSDNRPANLRDVTVSENTRNRNNAKRGLAGTHQIASGRFDSSVFVRGARIYLGRFDTEEEAHACHVRADEFLRQRIAGREIADRVAARAIARQALQEMRHEALAAAQSNKGEAS
jgi:hypothetical protein